MQRRATAATLWMTAGTALLMAPWPAARAQQAQSTDSLEIVVVTAQRLREQLEAERALVPGAVTIVDGEDSFERKVGNVADMLRYVPGVWTESSAGADEIFFSSRGSNLDATDYDRNGVKLLQDGLPVTTADGNNHNRVMDPLSARYATVAHGANALTYGASTLGGAIDFITPTARNSDPLAVFLSGGSFGELSGRGTAGVVSGAFDALVTVEAKTFDGYRAQSALDRSGVYANAGWNWSQNATTRVYATWVDSKAQLPGALTRDEIQADPSQAGPSSLAANRQKNVETWRFAARNSWTIDARSSLDVGLSFEEQSLFHPIVEPIMVDFDGPGPAPPVEVFSLLIDTDHRDIGASMRYQLQAGSHDLLAGANYGDGTVRGGNYRNNAGVPNGLVETVDNSAHSLELFVMDRWKLTPAWTLVYGGQYVDAGRDVRTTAVASGDVRNPNASYSSFNPRVGVIRQLTGDSELFASVSRVFEAPTTFEMEDDVRGGNATLDAMHGTVAEAGLRGSATSRSDTHWRWDATVYYARIRDEILSVDDPVTPGNSLVTNIDSTTHAGIEALLGASFTAGGAHRLEPLLSVTLNRFSFDSDPTYGNNRLPAAPRYAVRGELVYRHANGLYAGPTFDLIGRRFADFSNTYAVGSYGLLGVRGGFTAKTWEVFAELRNLFDRNYVSTLTVLNQATPDSAVLYPGAPRSAYVGGRLRF